MHCWRVIWSVSLIDLYTEASTSTRESQNAHDVLPFLIAYASQGLQLQIDHFIRAPWSKVLHQFEMGQDMKAYVLVTTKSGTAEKVAKAFKKIKSVTSTECVYGRFDVIVIIESPEMNTIDRIVHTIQRHPEVLHTETALSHCTEDYQSEMLKSQGIIE